MRFVQIIIVIFLLAFFACKPSKVAEKAILQVDSMIFVVNTMQNEIKPIPYDSLKIIFPVVRTELDTLKKLIGNSLLDSATMRNFGGYSLLQKNLKRLLPLYEKYISELNYSMTQLSSLKNDITSGTIDKDSIIIRYCNDEINVLNQLQDNLRPKIRNLNGQLELYYSLRPQIHILIDQYREKARLEKEKIMVKQKKTKKKRKGN